MLADEIKLHGSLESEAKNSLSTSAFSMSVATTSPFSLFSDLSYFWPFFSDLCTCRVTPYYSSCPLPRSIPSVPCLSLSYHYTSRLNSCTLSRSLPPLTVFLSYCSVWGADQPHWFPTCTAWFPTRQDGELLYSKKSGLKDLPILISSLSLRTVSREISFTSSFNN